MFVWVSSRLPDLDQIRFIRARYLGTALARRAALRRSLTVFLAATTGFWVFNTVSAAEHARSGWGTAIEVVALRRTVDVGEEVTSEDLYVREVPAALVPDDVIRFGTDGSGAVDDLSSVRTGRARRHLASGELLTMTDTGSAANGPIAAALSGEQQAVTAGVGPNPPPLEPGDLVDIYGPASRATDQFTTSPIERVATGATVMAVTDDSVTFAVDAHLVANVLNAASKGLHLVITNR